MATKAIPRYVVLVYMYDHWGVTYETDDQIRADEVQAKAAIKVPLAVVVDSQRGSVLTMAVDPRKCERDWQGPSDDECVDDLLVVACVRRTTEPHHWHVGVVEDGIDAHVRMVYWLKGTDDLYDYRTDTVYRRQFADRGEKRAPIQTQERPTNASEVSSSLVLEDGR